MSDSASKEESGGLRVISRSELAEQVDIGKASIIAIDGEMAQRSKEPQDEEALLFKQAGVLPPPYDAGTLCTIYENSSALRQNVDAYVTNIDAFGFRLVPNIDLESESAEAQLEGAIFMERLAELPDESKPPALPSSAEIETLREEVRIGMLIEKSRLSHFFEFINPEMSFTTIRRRLRQDMEVMGNGYLEVLRNKKAEVAQIIYVPGFTMRLMPLDRGTTEFDMRVRVSDVTFTDVKTKKRFRRYVQVFQSTAIFFKEFGDPRTVSSKTGKAYVDLAEMMREENVTEEEAKPATEIIHFDVHSPTGPYGVPRWIGNLLSVLGTRQAEEVNFLLFENKAVPPLAILVSGGRLAAGVAAKIKEFLENMKGKAAFHSVLVLEAVPANAPMPGVQTPHSGQMRIQLQPLTSASQNDAMFMNYDERNMDKIGQSFRLPRLLRGDIRDFNRATAESSLLFAEQQVFGPEREEFDFIINRKLMTSLDAKYFLFQSNAPAMRDPETLAKILKSLREYITPGEAREAIAGVLNRELKKVSADWTRQPAPFTLAGIPVEGSEGDDDEEEEETTETETETETETATGDETEETETTETEETEEKKKKTGKKGKAKIANALAEIRARRHGEMPPRKQPKKKKLQSKALAAEAALLIQLRDKLLNEETKIAGNAMKIAKQEGDKLVIQIPADKLAELFEE